MVHLSIRSETIREVETNHDVTPDHGYISYDLPYARVTLSYLKYGQDFHLTKVEAVACQMRYREQRIREAIQEAARLQNLPPLAA